MWADMPLGWWKTMELTFGGLLGLAYVLCAWRLRHQLAGSGSTVAASTPLARAFLAAIIGIGLAVVSSQYVPARFDYTIAGAVLASLLFFSDSLAWQTAITATCAAFEWDFLDYQTFAPRPLAWTFLVATTTGVAVIVARYPRTRAMLLLVSWLAVANAFRYLLPPSAVGREAVTMLTVFVFLALAMSLMLLPRPGCLALPRLAAFCTPRLETPPREPGRSGRTDRHPAAQVQDQKNAPIERV